MTVSAIDVRQLINQIAASAGAPIAIPSEITGKITVKLHQAPWPEALQAIVAGFNYKLIQDSKEQWFIQGKDYNKK